MSGSQLLRTVVGIPIYLAREVSVKGRTVTYRLVDVIDQDQKDNTAAKVASALEGDKMLSEEQKKNVKAVEVTYVRVMPISCHILSTQSSSMPHKSPLDSVPHISITVQMASGGDLKAHVPNDESEQQVFGNCFLLLSQCMLT
jgi:hypothetical protein